MSKPTLIALDTETGGLDQRANPLLSIAIVVADETYNKIDGFEIKVAPPRNAFLEVATPSTRGLENKRKTLLHFQNVWTKETTMALPEGAMLITAYAAEVNGYIGEDDIHWDFAAVDKWNASSQDLPAAETDLLAYLTKGFGESHVVTVAHNAIFDQKFVESNMPRLYNKLKQPWFCTLEKSREFNKKRGVKGGGKLTEMAKLAGFDYDGHAHEAFADGEATLAVLRFLQQQAQPKQLPPPPPPPQQLPA
ncbi:MAG: 3'-5' exonuclease [Phycisphaerae bacterium]|jgi:DNA polymerase III epsilon subunit-like protein